MPSRDDRPLMVTSALPYANGPIHFGHVAGAYLPADIFVRYHRLLGTDVAFISGTDEHGVSITIRAEQEGTSYRDYVGRWHREIVATFELFDISFDHFSRTSNEDPHYGLSQEFFLRLLRTGNVAPRAEKQHYCNQCERFLPDRYVEGTCYVCGKAAARGDECKACGSWLEATRIVEPRCVTCGSTPEVRDTLQFELDMSPISGERAGLVEAYGEPFAAWLDAFEARLKPNVRATVFDKIVRGEGLKPRAITRDLRWGVPVPARDLDGEAIADHEGKVLYVWFDAPIGYVSATIEWMRLRGREDDWRRYWILPADADESAGPRLVHFIGKDNIPFHCIVFPAMLAGQGEASSTDVVGAGPGERWVLPENVPSNEFYNLEGRKFSTSDDWMLDSDRMFEIFGGDALRWYLTVSMPETADSQFLFDELQSRVNSELADTVGNYASRVLKFTRSHLEGRVPEVDGDHAHAGDLDATAEACRRAVADVGAHIESCAFRQAAVAALELARFGNKLFDERAPWKARKEDMAACRISLHCHLQALATLSVVLTPFTPAAAGRLREMLALPALESGAGAARATEREGESAWRVETLPVGHALGEPGILFAKIPDEVVEAEKERLGARA